MPQRPARQNRKIGLALSGGSLKAAAHIGVLERLESMGIRPDCVAGTSAGSFVATLYAHGYTPQEMTQLIETFPGAKLVDYAFPFWSSVRTLATYHMFRRTRRHLVLPSGLLRGRRLQQYFDKSLQGRALGIPCFVIATDLYSAAPVVYQFANMQENHRETAPDMYGEWATRTVYTSQDVAQVVRGSCSLPGIFTPVQMDPHLLVDGGLRDYVPVEVLRAQGCTHIIAVNLYRLERNWNPESFIHVMGRSFDILLQETIDGDTLGDDVLALQPDVGDLSWLSFSELDKCQSAGRHVVSANEDKIWRFLGKG